MTSNGELPGKKRAAYSERPEEAPAAEVAVDDAGGEIDAVEGDLPGEVDADLFVEFWGDPVPLMKLQQEQGM